MLKVGTSLGPYLVEAPLGAGGMGEVYRAMDTRLGRAVAVKVIAADLAGDPSLIHRFEREARAAGALNHPNLCSVFDVGLHDGTPFVVMELLEGESLHHRLRQGPLPLRKALEGAAQIARGLAAAHAKGMVHRDLKPANVFLTRDGRFKILDFGLAKLTRPDLTAAAKDDTVPLTRTMPGVLMGTIGYMAPEQVRGEDADSRSDVFALGAVLYEMLTGTRAFPGDTFPEIAYRILHDDPPRRPQPAGSGRPAWRRSSGTAWRRWPTSATRTPETWRFSSRCSPAAPMRPRRPAPGQRPVQARCRCGPAWRWC